MIVKPKALKPGDTIGVVAAASNIKQVLLQQGCRELERLGFKTYCRPDITSSFRYLSGPHERRIGHSMGRWWPLQFEKGSTGTIATCCSICCRRSRLSGFRLRETASCAPVSPK